MIGVLSLRTWFFVAVLALGAQAFSTASVRASSNVYFSPELGLELRLVKYRLLNHPEPMFNLALQVSRIVPGNHVDTYACVGTECSKNRLVEDKVLPLQVGDVLLFDQAIVGGDLHIWAFKNSALSDAKYRDGKYYVPRDCLGTCLPLEVADAAGLLDLVTGVDKRVPRELSFRIARPSKYVETHHTLQIDYNATILYYGVDHLGAEYTGYALLKRSPPGRLGDGYRNSMFTMLNPLCTKKYLKAYGRPDNGACGPAQEYKPMELSKESLIGLVALGMIAYIAGKSNQEQQLQKMGCREEFGQQNSGTGAYDCPVNNSSYYLEGMCGLRYWICPKK